MENIEDAQCFLMGSFPLRTYLPDSDVDIALLMPICDGKLEFARSIPIRKVMDALCSAALSVPPRTGYILRNVDFINAKTPIVRCTVNNIDLDITLNQARAQNILHVYPYRSKVQHTNTYTDMCVTRACWLRRLAH
jgi:hypothetical protein